MIETTARHPDTSFSHTLPSRFARRRRRLAHPSHALASPPSGVLVRRAPTAQSLGHLGLGATSAELLIHLPAHRPERSERYTVVSTMLFGRSPVREGVILRVVSVPKRA